MSFTSTEKLKNEYVAEIVSSLSFALLQAGDNAGLVMFSDKINYHLLPSGGNRQYYQILQGLSDPKNYEGKKNFKRGIDFLMTYLKDRSVVVIISDFIGVEEDWQQSLATALAKFEIIAMMVRDPRDDTMPEGAGHVVLSDPFSKAQKVIDPLYIGQKYATIAKSQKSEILREFAKIDADIIELRTDKDYLHPILKLFKKREKRMR
jgi:uncharacterized protein (DUF58 family)